MLIGTILDRQLVSYGGLEAELATLRIASLVHSRFTPAYILHFGKGYGVSRSTSSLVVPAKRVSIFLDLAEAWLWMQEAGDEHF